MSMGVFFADTGVGCWYYKFLGARQTDVDGRFCGRHRSCMLVLQLSSNMSNRCRWAFFSLSQKCINDGADTLNYKQHKPSDPKQHLRRCRHRCYSVTIHYIMLTMRPHTERIWTTYWILTVVKNGSLILRLHTDSVLTRILTAVKNGSLILRPHTDRILTGY